MTEYFLSHGSHRTAADGRCAMEWVSYLAGEQHSDQPVCVSPVLRRFCISLNDRLPDAERQKLRPYLARTIGTVGDGMDQQRVQMCREFLLRQSLPFYLDKAGRHEAAQKLRDLPADLTVEATGNAIQFARDEAWAARSVARDRLAAKIRAELAKRGLSAVAAAAAAADADAVADAAAVAAADAVAVAAADADAAAAADAAAVAAAAADADAAAAAAAVAVAVAAADADAAAAADAAAVAAAAADADAAAAAAADAVAAAVAAAAADAAAVAAAAADAVAVAVAARRYSTVYNAVRKAVCERAEKLAREWAEERNALTIPAAFDLLDRMLPTEVIQFPAVEDAEAICGVPIRA